MATRFEYVEEFWELIFELNSLIDEIRQKKSDKKKKSGNVPLELKQVSTSVLTAEKHKLLADQLGEKQGPEGIER